MKVKVIRWTKEELVGVRNCQGWFQGGFKGAKVSREGRKLPRKGRKEASKGREERSFQ